MQGFNNNGLVLEHFVPQVNTHYRIVSVLDPSKALTISNNKLTINTYTKDNSQHFTIGSQGDKYAFIVQSTNTGLCVYFDKSDNGADVVTDGGLHNSSWFSIERVSQGMHANKAYYINTFCGKRLDIEGGNIANNGNRVIQWEKNNGNNQIWQFLPVEQGWEKQAQSSWDNKTSHSHHPHPGHHGHHGHHDEKSGSGQGFGVEM